MTAKSISIKDAKRKFGGRVRKVIGLTSGDLCRVSKSGLRKSGGFLTSMQKSAEGKVGMEIHSEGPNGPRKGLKGEASRVRFS